MNKLSVRDIEVNGKRVLVRVDFNVPIDSQTGEISDDSRIKATIPTIDYLIQQGARIILCSHLGRPEGKIVESLRLAGVGRRLSQILRQEVRIAPDSIGTKVQKMAMSLENGDVMLLENLRFHIEEQSGDKDYFARELAKLAEVYVNDAFGTAHRRHASIVGVAKYLPAVAGMLLGKELNSLGRVLEEPPKPFGILLGGAKVSDKVAMLENVISSVDCILIGGGMAATFLKAKSYEVGNSLLEDSIETAAEIVKKARRKKVRLLLPEDVVVVKKISPRARRKNLKVKEIPKDGIIVDIGSLTITNFTKTLEKCRTIFWNGPMGIYEIAQFAEGTRTMAKFISNMHANTIVGGGSTAEVVIEMGLADKMSFVSTGGGASLRFLNRKKLPGVEVLMDK
jgi:phosphoglycerate kinase